MHHEDTQTISLPVIVSILRRNLLVIVGTIVLAVAVSLVISSLADPKYKAKSVIAFNDESADLQVLGTPATPDFQPDKLAAAQAERITRVNVIDRVRKKLGVKMTTAELQDAVSTEVEAASNLVTISAEASTGTRAADLANGFAAAVRADTTQSVRRRYAAAARSAAIRSTAPKGKNPIQGAVAQEQATRLNALATFARPVDIVRAAQVPSNPASPRPVRNALLAALLGVILGVGIAFLRHVLDQKLRDAADVEASMDIPVVGMLRTAALGHVPISKNGGPPESEEDVEPFRILRTNIAFLAGDRGVPLLLVTSPQPEVGKSTVAAGLAWAEAMTGQRTLLVECDLRRPALAERLGVEPAPGLSDYMIGEADPSEILRTVSAGGNKGSADSNLVVISAGRPVPNHTKLLESERFRGFLRDVSAAYDRVILDTPPLLAVSDTLTLLPQVDGMLVCFRLGQTTRHEAAAAKTALERFPKKPTGVVLTGADRGQSPYYAGYYTAPTLEEVD